MGSRGGRRDATPRSRQAVGPGRTYHLRLTGAFALRSGDEPIPLPISSQRLIAYLALCDGGTQRSHVAGTFWPDLGQDRAMANLRSVIWRIRGSGHDLIAADDGQLSLQRNVVVDTRELRRTAFEILESGDGGDPTGLDALVRGDEILPDWSDEWVLVDRERYHQLRLHALERLCGLLAATGRFGLAVEACLAALAAEPLRESVQRQLIEVYLSEGNRADALRQFTSYQRVIREEVGVEPSREIADLVSPLTVARAPGTDAGREPTNRPSALVRRR
jgi:DNA-binding SARP family transcriptional activator